MDKKILKKFGSRLAKIRQEKKMTQDKVAYLSEISSSHLSDIERGVTNISLMTLFKLAKTLDTQASKLIEGL